MKEINWDLIKNENLKTNRGRAQLARLLDPENDKVQLDTLYKAASAVGKELHLELV